MPRYWVIAPHDATQPELWERMWAFDLEKGVISIGWAGLGNAIPLSREELRAALDRLYSDDPPAVRGLYTRMVWDFCHEIQPGDFLIARRGNKRRAAVGQVKTGAYFSPDLNAILPPDFAHHTFIDVLWNETPRDYQYPVPVFGIQTLYEISEEKFTQFVGSPPTDPSDAAPSPVQAEFVLEKYLEDFLVTNFETIFHGRLRLYTDQQGQPIGQQFPTDVGAIDILAREPATNSIVVIELKKGRESDKVVGQILRYMGWVAENVATSGQAVKGIIVCREPDHRITYALKLVQRVSVKYYRVQFQLTDRLTEDDS